MAKDVYRERFKTYMYSESYVYWTVHHLDSSEAVPVNRVKLYCRKHNQKSYA